MPGAGRGAPQARRRGGRTSRRDTTLPNARLDLGLHGWHGGLGSLAIGQGCLLGRHTNELMRPTPDLTLQRSRLSPRFLCNHGPSSADRSAEHWRQAPRSMPGISFDIGDCESQAIRHKSLASARPAGQIESSVKFVRKNARNPPLQRKKVRSGGWAGMLAIVTPGGPVR